MNSRTKQNYDGIKIKEQIIQASLACDKEVAELESKRDCVIHRLRKRCHHEVEIIQDPAGGPADKVCKWCGKSLKGMLK